ncbi:ribosomal RNA small subunit methyltransferase E [Candidatus Pelagibacter sp. IMCC9063]|uniref:RsmE family RNA methyltransferase n=1 Tax=Pelagibacter sp. (strain IMCC9063) TaxID=1002672 RepID=UPI000204640A|nr:RsmE family RNA methyltransferase [Candidatus Pelagibacter sp. IMCC9063]AEA81142.1 ribosomal RNA small subunit methyltransferase E [Candidatus Pelagibacter sp. IMCC9063]
MQKKIRIFLSERLEENNKIELGKDQSHYISNVMRLKSGDELLLFNGIDGEFLGKVAGSEKKQTIIQVHAKQRDQSKPSNISLAFCPLKGQRLDFLIQKCTEVGLKSFIPVISDHTIVRNVNENRLKKIIIESSEQSDQLHIPQVLSALNLEEFLHFLKKEDVVLFGDISSKNNDLTQLIEDKSKNYILFIGPEGDFSPKEREIILKNVKFKSFSLGKNILRSETAAIAGLVLLNFLLN